MVIKQIVITNLETFDGLAISSRSHTYKKIVDHRTRRPHRVAATLKNSKCIFAPRRVGWVPAKDINPTGVKRHPHRRPFLRVSDFLAKCDGLVTDCNKSVSINPAGDVA